MRVTLLSKKEYQTPAIYLMKDKLKCSKLANEKVVLNILYLVKTTLQHLFISRSNLYCGFVSLKGHDDED